MDPPRVIMLSGPDDATPSLLEATPLCHLGSSSHAPCRTTRLNQQFQRSSATDKLSRPPSKTSSSAGRARLLWSGATLAAGMGVASFVPPTSPPPAFP